MKCADMEDLIFAYANGELHRTQREFAEEHLAGCPDCRADLADHTWVGARLTSLKATPMRSDIKERTMLKIEAIQATRRPIRWALRPALAVTAVAAAIIAALVLQLSGGGPGVGIASAYAATEALKSFRMSGTTVSSFGGSTSEVSYYWEFVAPNRYSGSVTTPTGLEEFVIVGDEQYYRTSDSGGADVTRIVIDAEGYDVFSPDFVPTRAGTLQMLDSLVDVESLADETIDGIATLHYRGRVDMDRIIDAHAALLDTDDPHYRETVQILDFQRATTIDVELWIDAGDSSLRQMKLDGESPTFVSDQDGSRFEGSSTFTTFVKYTDLNAPISIDRPVGADGVLEQGWGLAGSGPPAPQVNKLEVGSDGQ
jgi:hypothetical protein